MTRVVAALQRGIAILGLFLADQSELSLPEIASALDLPRSTVHELVATLVSEGYLVRVDERRVALGVRLFELGNAYAESLDLVTVGSEVLRELAAETQETCHLAVLEGPDVLYVAKVDSTHGVRMVSAVGRRVPAHCTAIGKALLAALNDAEVRTRCGKCRLQMLTPNSITTVEGLLAELEQVRARGYGIDDCESMPDVRCVGLPIRDHRGQVVAAMSVSVPVLRAEGWPDAFMAPLRRAAAALSERLGAGAGT